MRVFTIVVMTQKFIAVGVHNYIWIVPFVSGSYFANGNLIRRRKRVDDARMRMRFGLRPGYMLSVYMVMRRK